MTTDDAIKVGVTTGRRVEDYERAGWTVFGTWTFPDYFLAYHYEKS